MPRPCSEGEACLAPTEWENLLTVLNTFLAVAGWVWTVLVLFFAAGYAVAYKSAKRDGGDKAADAQ